MTSLHDCRNDLYQVNPVRPQPQPQPQPQPSAPERFNGVKVFSATMYLHRRALGEVVTGWLAKHPTIRLCDFVVRQSSDHGFHCLSICVFYRDASGELGAVR